MYRPITMYELVCDRCDRVFEGTDTLPSVLRERVDDIGIYSDWEEIDDKEYCPDCYEVNIINGKYNVKVKK